MAPVAMCRCHAPLRPTELYPGWSFKCDGCEETSHKFDYLYVCTKGCNFTVHKECHTPFATFHHPFFPQMVAVFSSELPHGRRGMENLCEACGVSVKGCNYMFAESGYPGPNNVPKFIHPCCINLSLNIQQNGEHFTLKDKLVDQNCGFCRKGMLHEKVSGWAYVSALGNSSAACHIKCMNDLISQCHQQLQQQQRQGTSQIATTREQLHNNRGLYNQPAGSMNGLLNLFTQFIHVANFASSVANGDFSLLFDLF